MILNDKEMDLYYKAKKTRLSAKELNRLKAKYTIHVISGLKYVLTECKRPGVRGCDQPDFDGTGLALAGVLRNGETLDDFVQKMEWIKPVIEWRARQFDIARRKGA